MGPSEMGPSNITDGGIQWHHYVMGQGGQADGEPDDWLGFGDDDDAFAAEIAAVGTHLQLVCQQCGSTFTEHNNSDLACRWHPGIKKVDAAWNSVWTCCGLKHAMRGCKVGAHIPVLGDDVEDEEDET